MNIYIGEMYPEKTLIQVIKLIFGKWIGTIISASFIYLCLLTTFQITWHTGNIIVTQYLTETPHEAVELFTVIALVLALQYGLEALARASKVFIIFLSVMLILSMILVLPNVKFENLLPAFENGLMPTFQGVFILSSYTIAPLILMNMIYPSNITNLKDAKKSMYKGYLWASFLVFLPSVMCILVLGSSIASNTQYPTFLLAKEINIGIIFTRLEAIITSLWSISNFVAAAIFFYGAVIGIAQLFGLKDYRKIVLPLGLIVMVFANVVYPDSTYQVEWDIFTWVPYMTTFGVLLPLALLIGSLIKKFWIIYQNK